MNKSVFLGIALSTIFSLNLEAFAQPLPKLRQNMLYKDARKLLIKAGWQAVFNPLQVNNPNRSRTIDYLIKQKGYTEVVDCSGTGLGFCLFKFKNATGQAVLITTVNNDRQQESKVHAWRLEQARR